MGFRKDFVWGAATAAYQIEGAAFEDGKGLSIWDVYCNADKNLTVTASDWDVGTDTVSNEEEKEPNIFNNENGNVACDHYHRYKEDVKLMAELGLKAYRFSINWPRLIPEGTGKINEKGAKFYSDLVDELLSYGIEPYVTLFHWEYPQALEERGGWLNPESSDWFAEYAKVVVDLFGDRVKYYMTFNEFQCFVNLGYRSAKHAPGKAYSDADMVRVAHHILMAHGKAVKALREGNSNCKVSVAPCGRVYMPAEPTLENIEAARKRYFQYDISNFVGSVGFWSDAIVLGIYSEEYLKDAEAYLPNTYKDDLTNIIAQPLDFYCQNLYNGFYGVADENGEFQLSRIEEGTPHTAKKAGWYIRPEVLYWGPKFLCDRYKLPLYITENGTAMCDCVCLDGKVHDPVRIDYIHRYLLSLQKLADEGYDIRGYFAWSFLDNFEWKDGYFARFGIVWVDYQTLERIPKDSYYWYRDVIKNNGEKL